MNTVCTRTYEEIAARIKDLEADDFLGFQTSTLIGYLPFQYAKDFLKPEAKAEEWDAAITPLSSVADDMKSYMSFAWDKATNHRGISAGRSVAHFVSWLWMLGDADGEAFAEDTSNYPPYGAPVLKYICDRYGIPMPSDEMVKRMASGVACSSECTECLG